MPNKPTATRDTVLHQRDAVFHSLGLFCGGLLAGVALWDVVLLCVTAGPRLSNLGRLYSLYQLLAAPSQALFSILLAVCTVSAFDRYCQAKIRVKYSYYHYFLMLYSEISFSILYNLVALSLSSFFLCLRD
uniref:Uncharacterized protein n=1 Tax=Eptatretus burgeri TaxID=7764 RepID=A0A8C4NFI3_EPTBU